MRVVLRILVHAFMALVLSACANDGGWRTASLEPVGLAPDPALVHEAVVQVYGARTLGIKGMLGVHTWVAVKPTGATAWRVHEVIGWRLGRAPSVVVTRDRAPDGRWFGAEPELQIDLPATAIGKDYLGSDIVGTAPSGSGWQFSLAGLFGLAVSDVDGVELNLLGLNFGVSPNGVKLPFVGLVGSRATSSPVAVPSTSTPL